MSKKKHKKKSKTLFEDSFKKSKKKKKKKNNISEYDFLFVDFWDDDPESQLAIYQEMMYNRTYSKWKSKISKKKRKELKRREHPIKYYNKKRSSRYDRKKVSKYAKKRKRKSKKNESEYDTILKVGVVALNILGFASRTGLIKVLFGSKVEKGAGTFLKIALSLLK